MTQDEEIKLLNSLAKKRKESIEMYSKGNRPELAEKEAQELAIIQEFLPKQLNDDEAKEIIQKLIAENNATAKDFGKMMGLAMKMLSGKYEGAKVQAILKELLQ
jgi:uncharacterized protein YqeY